MSTHRIVTRITTHSFDLAIGLRPHNWQEDFLDMEVVAELLEFVSVELCFIIWYDGVRDSVLVDNVLLDELLDLRGRDGRKCFCFNPLSEVVNSYYCVLQLPLPLWAYSMQSIFIVG